MRCRSLVSCPLWFLFVAFLVCQLPGFQKDLDKPEHLSYVCCTVKLFPCERPLLNNLKIPLSLPSPQRHSFLLRSRGTSGREAILFRFPYREVFVFFSIRGTNTLPLSACFCASISIGRIYNYKSLLWLTKALLSANLVL